MLRDGHPARLHLRRRPDRPCRPGARRPGLERRLPRLLGLRLLDQGALRRDRQALGIELGRGRRGARPRTRTTRSRSCSTRAARSDEFGWKPKTPLEEGVAAAIQYYRDYGIDRDVHAPEARAGEAAGAVSELGRAKRSSSSAAPGSSAATSCASCSRTTPRASLVVDNLLSAERENVPDDPRVDVRRGLDRRRRRAGELDDEFDYVFHLATYHGNQSSIADPLADHENNLITTLKLFERLKGFERAAEGRLRRLRLHARRRTRTTRPRRRPRTDRSRSISTARTRSPRSWASSTPSTTTSEHGLPTVAPASRTSTAPARFSAPGSGAERRRRSGAT